MSAKNHKMQIGSGKQLKMTTSEQLNSNECKDNEMNGLYNET